jgi:hypothetical protein
MNAIARIEPSIVADRVSMIAAIVAGGDPASCGIIDGRGAIFSRDLGGHVYIVAYLDDMSDRELVDMRAKMVG